jgi:cold shock CspA family protein/ribosome-associated translation inhibitor RaiA
MQLTPTITFRGVERTTALDTDILTRLRKLDAHHRRIVDCRILVELVQRHHEVGNRYHVRIDLTVPGGEIVVSHEAGLHASAQDVEAKELTKVAESHPERRHARVAIREAFDIARRRLQDYARRQRGAVKTAARQTRGRVSQFFPVDGYGYIAAEDGREVYFQQSSVLKDAFDRLAIGSAVSFVEEDGEKGPQASTVRLLHPRRVHRASHLTAGARVVR